jgi:hypothetical protein
MRGPPDPNGNGASEPLRKRHPKNLSSFAGPLNPKHSEAIPDLQARSFAAARPDEDETFGEDERLAREHAEYFSDDYLEELFDLAALKVSR